jgi:glutaredoxin 3
MADVEIYVTDNCAYCVRAKALLRRKNVSFKEIDVTSDPAKRAWLMETTGQRTVPQIFIDGHGVGGADDLFALEREGKLDGLLAQTSPHE